MRRAGRGILSGAMMALLIVLAGATPGAAGRLPRYGGTVRVTVDALPASLDPLQLGSDDGALIAGCLYEGLTRWDGTQVAPGLAERWTHDEEAQRWRFQLREAQFHDGTRCDAAAVGRALERLADPRQSFYAWLLSDLVGWDDFAAGRTAHLAGIDVQGGSAIELDFTARANDVPARLALPVAGIARKQGNDWLGTGPFEFEHGEADALRLVASRDHALGRPYLDRVEFAAGPDTAATAFDTGRIVRMRPTDADFPGTIRRRSAASRLGFLLVGPKSTRFGDEAIRHKLALGFDRSVFVRVYLRGDGEPSEDLLLGNARRVASRNGEGNAEVAIESKEPARIVVNQSEPVLRALGERLQVHLFALGMQAVVDALPASEFARTLAEARYDIAVLGWTPPQPDGEMLGPGTGLMYFTTAVLQPVLGPALPEAWMPARLAGARDPGAVLLRGDLCIPLVFFHDVWQTPGDLLHLGLPPEGPGLEREDTHFNPHWP